MAQTRYSLYCDESNIHNARYMLIGGLWIPQQYEMELREGLSKVRHDFNMTAEFKWTKVSNSKLAGYYAWVDCFFRNKNIVRSIVIDTNLLDYRAFHKNDQNLAFEVLLPTGQPKYRLKIYKALMKKATERKTA
jgi:hypothetical protein